MSKRTRKYKQVHPVHNPGTFVAIREPIFVELDALISCGWGDVPREEIEKITRAKGYLPKHPPQKFRLMTHLEEACGVEQNG